MKFSKYIVAGCVALMGVATSCVGDLDLKPNDPNLKLELTTVSTVTFTATTSSRLPTAVPVLSPVPTST